MELKGAEWAVGLKAFGKGTRAGVVWAPRLGSVTEKLKFPDADLFFELGLNLALPLDSVTVDLESGTIAQGLAVSPIVASELDWNLGNYHSKTLAANTTLTFANVTASQRIEVYLSQPGGQAYTVTWPAGITWVAGPPGVIAAGTTLKVMLRALTTTTFEGSFVTGSAVPPAFWYLEGNDGDDFEGKAIPTMVQMYAIEVFCDEGGGTCAGNSLEFPLVEGVKMGLGSETPFSLGFIGSQLTLTTDEGGSRFGLRVCGRAS